MLMLNTLSKLRSEANTQHDDLAEVTQVAVRDLRIAADIGVHEYEIGDEQVLIVHVTADIPAPASDDLNATLDYCAIVAHAQVLAKQRIGLIETFASLLAQRCLASAAVSRVDVIVEKPNALPNGIAYVRTVRSADPKERR